MIKADDYIEIMQLYAAQAQAVDRGDGEAYAATFTPDGAINSIRGNVSGSAEIAQFARNSYASTGDEQNRHCPGQFTFTVISETELDAVYYLAVFIVGDDHVPRGKYMGFNTDRLDKRDGAWKIARRQGVPDPLSRGAKK